MDYLGGPKMPSQVLLLERKREISHSQKRRKQCGQGGKDWSDIVTIQGSLVTPETGKGKERPHLLHISWPPPGNSFNNYPSHANMSSVVTHDR